MRAKKLLSSRQIFRYAVPARTITKKALIIIIIMFFNESWQTPFKNSLRHKTAQAVTERLAHFSGEQDITTIMMTCKQQNS